MHALRSCAAGRRSAVTTRTHRDGSSASTGVADDRDGARQRSGRHGPSIDRALAYDALRSRANGCSRCPGSAVPPVDRPHSPRSSLRCSARPVRGAWGSCVTRSSRNPCSQSPLDSPTHPSAPRAWHVSSGSDSLDSSARTISVDRPSSRNCWRRTASGPRGRAASDAPSLSAETMSTPLSRSSSRTAASSRVSPQNSCLHCPRRAVRSPVHLTRLLRPTDLANRPRWAGLPWRLGGVIAHEGRARTTARVAPLAARGRSPSAVPRIVAHSTTSTRRGFVGDAGTRVVRGAPLRSGAGSAAWRASPSGRPGPRRPPPPRPRRRSPGP